jgi:CheY-like chemotaxis protein
MEKQKNIDLVILDMTMPGISGGEAFNRIREINPTVKVLLSIGVRERAPPGRYITFRIRKYARTP